MDDQLPSPVTKDHEYMAGVCRRLDVQNDLLAQVLDRLPAPVELTVAGTPGAVRIREPLAPQTPNSDTPTAGPAGSDPAPEPPARARRAPAKKAAAAVKEGTPDG